MSSDPLIHRGARHPLDRKPRSADLIRRAITDVELHRTNHFSRAESFGALSRHQQRLVDVVMGNGTHALEIHPVECHRDSLDKRLRDGIRVAEPFALDQLQPPPEERRVVPHLDAEHPVGLSWEWISATHRPRHRMSAAITSTTTAIAISQWSRTASTISCLLFG